MIDYVISNQLIKNFKIIFRIPMSKTGITVIYKKYYIKII